MTMKNLEWTTEEGILVARSADGLIRYRVTATEDSYGTIYSPMIMSYSWTESERMAGVMEFELKEDFKAIKSPYLEVAKNACDRDWKGQWPLVLNPLGL